MDVWLLGCGLFRTLCRNNPSFSLCVLKKSLFLQMNGHKCTFMEQQSLSGGACSYLIGIIEAYAFYSKRLLSLAAK